MRALTMSGTLKPLRIASWIEGATLVLLVMVAVPLKRLAGVPEAVSVLGPVHGAAFLTYLLMLAWYLHMRRLRVGAAAVLMAAALIPFGAFLVGRVFRGRKG